MGGESTVEKIGDGINYLRNVWRKVVVLTWLLAVVSLSYYRVRGSTSSQKLRRVLAPRVRPIPILKTYFTVDVAGPQNDSWWPYDQPRTDIESCLNRLWMFLVMAENILSGGSCQVRRRREREIHPSSSVVGGRPAKPYCRTGWIIPTDLS